MLGIKGRVCLRVAYFIGNMSRFNFLYFTVTILAIAWITFVQCQAPNDVPEPAAAAAPESSGEEAKPSSGEGAKPSSGEEAPSSSDASHQGKSEDSPGSSDANGTKGSEIWEKWNAIGMSENDTSWLTKYCPRDLTTAFEKICILHCWSNGWQGGRCTNQNICICSWEGIKLDPEAMGVSAVTFTETQSTSAPAEASSEKSAEGKEPPPNESDKKPQEDGKRKF